MGFPVLIWTNFQFLKSLFFFFFFWMDRIIFTFSHEMDFWTAWFSFWVLVQFLPMLLKQLLTAFRFLLDFLFFIIFKGKLLELKYLKPQKIPISDWTTLIMEYLITGQPQHLWQLKKTFFIILTFSLLDTRSEKGSWMNQWLVRFHAAEERNPSS